MPLLYQLWDVVDFKFIDLEKLYLFHSLLIIGDHIASMIKSSRIVRGVFIHSVFWISK
jgi:hypothetical protein